MALKFAKSIPYKEIPNSRLDVGVTTYSEKKFAKSTIYKDTIIQGWTLALQSLPYKDTKNLDVGVTDLQRKLKFAKSTVQRYKNSTVDDSTTNSQCPRNFQSLPCEDTRILGWTLVLRTYSVLEVCNSTPYSDRQNQAWTRALRTYGVLEIAMSTIHYKN